MNGIVLDALPQAIQIEVFEDSSFLLTDEGNIYSWGRNDHGFLGREAKIDIKSLAFNDKRKRLAFSTFTPGKVIKLE
jgi:alpha-tubulin suppressor-like RCC1 family protein